MAPLHTYGPGIGTDPGVRDNRRQSFHANTHSLKMMHNEEAFVDDLMHKKRQQLQHRAELEAQMDENRLKKQRAREAKRAEDEYWEQQWQGQQAKNDRARAQEDEKRRMMLMQHQNHAPMQPAPPSHPGGHDAGGPRGRQRGGPHAKRVGFADDVHGGGGGGGGGYAQPSDHGGMAGGMGSVHHHYTSAPPPPMPIVEAPPVHIRPSRVEAVRFDDNAGPGVMPPGTSSLVDMQVVFDNNDALGKVLRRGSEAAVKSPASASSEAVVSRLLAMDPTVSADMYLSQFAGMQWAPQQARVAQEGIGPVHPSLSARGLEQPMLAGPLPPSHAQQHVPVWLQPSPPGQTPEPTGSAGTGPSLHDIQLDSSKPMPPINIPKRTPRRRPPSDGDGDPSHDDRFLANVSTPDSIGATTDATQKNTPDVQVVAGHDLLKQLEALEYVTPIQYGSKSGAQTARVHHTTMLPPGGDDAGDGELASTSQMVAGPPRAQKAGSAPPGHNGMHSPGSRRSRPATGEEAARVAGEELVLQCSEPVREGTGSGGGRRASRYRGRQRGDGMDIPDAWVTFKGTVFELLTEEDIRRGGEDLVIQLAGAGTLVPNAPEIFVQSLHSDSPGFNASIQAMWPPSAWIMSPDKRSCRCTLQPTPDFRITTDVSVSIRATAAGLASAAVPIYPRSNPTTFSIRTWNDGGCV